MTRRDILTAIELAMAASALTAATYGLVIASYDPYAAVTWVPIVAMGLGTAGIISAIAAILFVGRTALLAADVIQVRRDEAEEQETAAMAPPSASAPLWPYGEPDPVALARDAYVIDECANPYAAAARHAAREAVLPATLPMPVEELVVAGQEAVGSP